MSSEPWTISSIHDALGSPTLASRFLAEINRAPAHLLLGTFAKWERIAKDIRASTARARELSAFDARGEELPGEWADATERVLGEAAVHRRGIA